MENPMQPKPENLAQSSAGLTDGAEPVLAEVCNERSVCGDPMPCPGDPPPAPEFPPSDPEPCC